MKQLQLFCMCVELDWLDPVTYAEVSQIRAVVLAELHTLEIVSPDNDPTGVLDVMAHWDLPSLKQVTLCGQRRVHSSIPFFVTHSPQLTTLEFNHIGDDAGRILELCSNITELVTHIHFVDEQILGGHETVERLGLRGLCMAEHSYSDRCNIVESLKAIFPIVLNKTSYPRIEVIRLLDYQQTRFAEQKWRATDIAFWAFLVKKFWRYGVWIEDHEGKVLGIKFSEATVMLPEEITFECLIG